MSLNGLQATATPSLMFSCQRKKTGEWNAELKIQKLPDNIPSVQGRVPHTAQGFLATVRLRVLMLPEGRAWRTSLQLGEQVHSQV